MQKISIVVDKSMVAGQKANVAAITGPMIKIAKNHGAAAPVKPPPPDPPFSAASRAASWL